MWHRIRHMACSEMSQRYNHIAGGNGISPHNLLFNLALTHPGATGAYLRHAVVGAISQPPAQLRKCRVTIRHATSWLSVGRSLRTPALRSRAPHRPSPGAASATMETITGGGHFCYPVRGWRLHSLWSSSAHRRRSSDGFPVGRRYKDTTQIVVKFGEIAISGAKTIFNVVFGRIFAPRTL